MAKRPMIRAAVLALATVAALSAQPVLTTIYNFSNSAGDGSGPKSTVAIGPGGVLYGTTSAGGSHSAGTVYSLTPPAFAGGSWTETVIYEFAQGNPVAGVTVGTLPGGGLVLYGTTLYGGKIGYGTVYSIMPPASPGGAWTETNLLTFTGNNGVYPFGGVTIGPGGVLYGTTQYGGSGACSLGCGTVFSLSPPATAGGAWTERVLHSFKGGDGYLPLTSLVIDGNGVLYGVTPKGGSGNCHTQFTKGCGTVFSLTPPATAGGAWMHTTLLDFAGTGDGSYPSSLVLGANGVLFGTTQDNVFQLAPPASPGGAWTETRLKEFYPPSDGNPTALTIGSSGELFGDTISGSSNGTIFSLTPPPAGETSWTFKAQWTFDPALNGYNPQGVTVGSTPAGQIVYGTTFAGTGAPYQAGTVFSLLPD